MPLERAAATQGAVHPHGRLRCSHQEGSPAVSLPRGRPRQRTTDGRKVQRGCSAASAAPVASA
eukprot:7313667-Pyramimonas_sp.AAC.1